jgi:ribosomal protein S4E
MLGLVTDGKNMGNSGRIESIETRSGRPRRRSHITIMNEEGRKFETICDYVLVIGDKEPRISLKGLEVD